MRPLINTFIGFDINSVTLLFSFSGTTWTVCTNQNEKRKKKTTTIFKFQYIYMLSVSFVTRSTCLILKFVLRFTFSVWSFSKTNQLKWKWKRTLSTSFNWKFSFYITYFAMIKNGVMKETGSLLTKNMLFAMKYIQLFTYDLIWYLVTNRNWQFFSHWCAKRRILAN